MSGTTEKENVVPNHNELDQELQNSVSSLINNYPDTKEETSSDIRPLTKIKLLLDTIKKLFYKNNKLNKRNIFITYVVMIVVLVCIVILYSTIKSSTANKSNSYSNSDSSKGNILHSKDADRSNNPEGYNADVFVDCGYNSNILGKKLSEIEDAYNLDVYNSETFQEDDRAYSIWPIIAKKGQTVARAMESNKSKSPNYFFILDDKDYVVGFIYEARGGLKEVSTFCKDLKIPPRKAACNPKMTNEDYVLCWKYGYGYHFIFARDGGNGSMYCMGYSDLIDPSQCLEFDNVVYSPIEQQYTDGNKMPEKIYDSLYGYFDNQIDNQEDNVRIEVVSPDSIHRSLLNCSANKKDYFYIDRFDSYESLGNNRYLIKVTCGDTKLSYLSEDVFNDDGTGHQTLYFNAVDGWNYSDNYIKNSKYVFYRDFTYGDSNSENNSVGAKEEPEIPNDNTANTTNTIMSELSQDILSEIGGQYEDGYGDTVDISSVEQVTRFIKGGNQSHTYDEKICGYKKTQDGYLLCIEWDDEKYTYLYKKTGETEYLYIGFDDGWEPNLNPYNYNEATVFIKTSDILEEPASSEPDSSIDTPTTEVSDNELYSVLARVDQAIFDYANSGKKPYFESNTKDLSILADNYKRFTTGSIELNGKTYPVVSVEVSGDTVLFWYDEICITWNKVSNTVISEIYDEY